jgi:Ca2+-binding RTX toxin-like protein
MGTYSGTNNPEAIYGSNNAAETDYIYAYAGNDTAYGYAGTDWIYGYAGNDYLYGMDGNDYLYGMDDNDYLHGGVGADSMYGGAGNDTYVVDNVGDMVVEYSGGGTDNIWSNVSRSLGDYQENLYLYGIDNINGYGNTLNNYMAGNSVNNYLNGGVGADSMYGGAGNDTYVVDNVGDMVVEYSGGGTDNIWSNVSRSLGDYQENLYLYGIDNINGYGNTLNNYMAGNSVNNYLNGGVGADSMYGGAGNDTYVVDNVGDMVVEYSGGGTDNIWSNVSRSLGDYQENLYLYGIDNINGYGNTLNNYMAGNSVNNYLNGGVGADSMYGGAGNDTYVVDNVGDMVVEYSGGGTDNIWSNVSRSLGDYQENLYLYGIDNINGYGNTLNNYMAGNSVNNYLNGGVGADSMYGGAGNDTYVVDNVGDMVVEYSGGGTDNIWSNVSRSLGDYQENLYLYGIDNINGYGNTLNNYMAGNSVNNYLNGGVGADSMYGGAGNDTYVVDNVGDIVVEYSGGGTDNIWSNVSRSLGDYQENLYLYGIDNINGYGNTLNNYMAGNSVNNYLNGGAGNDSLNGGLGNDTLLGYGSGTEYDYLNGDTGADRFILGSSLGTYYSSTGYATITGWDASDTLQLYGNASLYTFSTVGTSTYVYYNTNTDLIATVDAINISGNASYV